MLDRDAVTAAPRTWNAVTLCRGKRDPRRIARTGFPGRLLLALLTPGGAAGDFSYYAS